MHCHGMAAKANTNGSPVWVHGNVVHVVHMQCTCNAKFN